MRSVTAFALFAFAACAPALAQQPSASPPRTPPPDTGFFRPSADPALTSTRPLPEPRDAPLAQPLAPPPELERPVDVAAAMRKAEQQELDRAEQEHRRAREEASVTATGPRAAVSTGTPASSVNDSGRY